MEEMEGGRLRKIIQKPERANGKGEKSKQKKTFFYNRQMNS